MAAKLKYDRSHRGNPERKLKEISGVQVTMASPEVLRSRGRR